MVVRGLLAVGCAALLSTSAFARDADAGKVMPNGEKIICKRVEETGSLVKVKKTCYTRMQWDRIAEAARANGQRMQSDHASGITTN